MESEAETMLVDTGKWRMTLDENASLRAANARLKQEKDYYRELLSFARATTKSAIGNLIAFDAKVKHIFENVVK